MTTLPQDLREKLLSPHSDAPQKHGLIRVAIESIELGLTELAKFGHRFEISLSGRPAPEEFPKVLYHDDHPPEVVETKVQEEGLLAAGWRNHPSKGASAPPVLPPPPAPAPTILIPREAFPMPRVNELDRVQVFGANTGIPQETPFQETPVLPPAPTTLERSEAALNSPPAPGAP